MIPALLACTLVLAQVNTPEPLATPRYAPGPKRVAGPKHRAPYTEPTSDPHRLTVNVTLAPKASAPLDAFTASIGVTNATNHATVMHFASSDLYVIEVRKGPTVLWSSAYQHAAVPIARAIPAPIGKTAIANVTFDGTTNDRRALSPGAYTIRTTFLAFTPPTVVDIPLRINAATPISALAKMRNGSEVVVVGSPTTLADGRPGLTDGTGSIALSRNLGFLARGPHVVRGFVDITRDSGTLLVIGRYAPTFENNDSSPTPVPTATPAVTPTPIRTGVAQTAMPFPSATIPTSIPPTVPPTPKPASVR